MKHFSIPTQADQEDFLIRLCFGSDPNYLRLCVRRAYLDFCRTLDGISQIPTLYQVASAELENALSELRDDSTLTTQKAFDDWHRTTCKHLCSTYAQRGYSRFYVGQAQKWLNMSLKYIYVILDVVGDKRLSGYSRLYQFSHVPIDSIILSRLQRFSPPKLSVGSWSRLECYEEYLQLQQWIRVTFADSIPLAVEFHLWLEHNV